MADANDDAPTFQPAEVVMANTCLVLTAWLSAEGSAISSHHTTAKEAIVSSLCIKNSKKRTDSDRPTFRVEVGGSRAVVLDAYQVPDSSGGIGSQYSDLEKAVRAKLGEKWATSILEFYLGFEQTPGNKLTTTNFDVEDSDEGLITVAIIIDEKKVLAASAWAAPLKWDVEQTFWKWDGVVGRHKDDGRITLLMLPSKEEIKNSPIPAELFALTRLEALVLNGNNLTGPIPPHVGGLPELVTLHLYSNQLDHPIPREIGNLDSLQSLMLQKNKLSGHIPSEICRLTNLTQLHMECNNLSGHIPKNIGALVQLTGCYFHENKLSGPIPKSVSALTNMQWIRLGKNRLSGEIPKDIIHENTVWVYCGENELSGPLPDFSRATRLTDFGAPSNALTGPLPSDFSKCPALKMVDLSQNKISGPIPAGISQATSLQTLYLSSNNLEGDVPAELANLALRYVMLDDNKLNVESAQQFQGVLKAAQPHSRSTV